MMKFLHTLIATLTKKDFYASVIRGEKNLGFGFVFKLQILAALFLTVLLSINISAVLPHVDTLARSILPPGAEVIIKNGELETNANPIVIAFPKKSGIVTSTESASTTSSTTVVTTEVATSIASTTETGSFAGIKNILVLDVTASTTLSDLEKKDTLILITAEGIIVRNDVGKISVAHFNDVKNLDVLIDEAWLIDKADWVKNFAKFLPFIAFFFLLVSLYLGALLAALLYGFATWLIFKLMKKPQPFKTAYSVGLYSRTFATLLGLVAFILPIVASNFVLVPLEVLFIIVMIKDIRKAHTLEQLEHKV